MLKEEILLELDSWMLGGTRSKMKEVFGAPTQQMKVEIEEEIKRLKSVWRTPSTYPGDVSLATLVVMKGVPAKIRACDISSCEARTRAETGGLTAEANRTCATQRAVELLWWKRGTSGVHFDWIAPQDEGTDEGRIEGEWLQEEHSLKTHAAWG